MESFGFHAIVVDGHDVTALYNAFTEAEKTKGKPTCVLAKTYKGQGFPGIADEMNWHGKALGAKTEEIVAHLKTLLKSVDGPKPVIPPAVADAPKVDITGIKLSEIPSYTKGTKRQVFALLVIIQKLFFCLLQITVIFIYGIISFLFSILFNIISNSPINSFKSLGESLATRQAYGNAIVKLAKNNDRVVALDGDMKNSTFSQNLRKVFPERHVECFICEQNLAGVSLKISIRITAEYTRACSLNFL